jgi:hypothetical protein
MPSETLVLEYANNQSDAALRETLISTNLSFSDSPNRLLTQDFTFQSAGGLTVEVSLQPLSWTPVLSHYKPFDSWALQREIMQPAHTSLRVPQWIFPSKMLEISIQIPSELVEMADDSALSMLSSKTNLIPFATNMYLSALSQFTELGLSASCSLTSFRDPESEDSDTLVFQVKIHGKSYVEILKIWDQLSMRLLSHLPVDIQKSVSVVADEA